MTIPLTDCPICKHIGEYEYAGQKFGSPEDDIFLPDATKKLEWVGAVPLGSRFVAQKKCPVCHTYYRYELSYEYFVNGSEDKETLTRLTPTDVREK